MTWNQLVTKTAVTLEMLAEFLPPDKAQVARDLVYELTEKQVDELNDWN